MDIALIDTAHANLRSVERALLAAAKAHEARGGKPVRVLRTHDPEVVHRADKMVVPGQGGFGDCMAALTQGGLDEAIRASVAEGKQYLGICLGLQALFESSPEAPGVKGLGLFRGHCERLLPEPGIKIPHMGWNQLSLRGSGHRALVSAGGEGAWLYFVHSYHGIPTDSADICATVQHGTQTVTAAVARDNVLATQFHPEKSQAAGLRLLEGFIAS